LTISRDAVLEWLKAFAVAIETQKDYLTQLDSEIGDADHGANMTRGLKACVEALPSVADKDIGSVFKAVGMKLISTVGGASGPLYGTLFLQMATTSNGKLELSLAEWVATLEAGINGVLTRGRANLGDKTMIDALSPALVALKTAAANGASLSEALRLSAEACAAGRDATIPLVAKKGRASYLGERSAGHQDPGATSSAIMLQTIAEVWGKA